MRSKVSAPTAAQREWREKVRRTQSIISGREICEIHHVAGRTAKFDKQAIGHWWILPLTTDEHRLIGNPDDFARKYFGSTFIGRWDLEKLLFADLLTKFNPDELPFTELELQAIWNYRR